MGMTYVIDTSENNQFDENLFASEFGEFIEVRIDAYGRWHEREYSVDESQPDGIRYYEWIVFKKHEVIRCWGQSSGVFYDLTFTHGVLETVQRLQKDS